MDTSNLSIDFYGLMLATVGVILYPVYNRINIRRDLLYNMVNVFEGFFYSSSRHSVYNTLRLGEVLKKDVNEFKSYNIDKQKYDCGVISDFKKDFVVVFPPEFVKKIIQYELLSRNFNSDVDSLKTKLSSSNLNLEKLAAELIELNSKNVRLFNIGNHRKEFLEEIRVNKIDSASNGLEETKFYKKYSRKFRRAFGFLNIIFKFFKSCWNIIETLYYDFTGRSPVYYELQKDIKFVDEIVIDDKIDRLKLDFGHYISLGRSEFRTLYDITFDKIIDDILEYENNKKISLLENESLRINVPEESISNVVSVQDR